jgi:4-diphosphocytidyl-2-C-methyl-D-erythritol kinase
LALVVPKADGSLSWPAPAKLNLFLHILRRRADGYHELQTAFQFIDLCDELRFEPRADGRILRLAGFAEVPEAEDLVLRAARRLREAARSSAGASISVRKRIPLQSGLGGGSSDAATTLVALNALWNLQMSVDALAQLGLELGADVPVFVRGRAAWAEGVGERLQPLKLVEPVYLVVRPPCTVSTREIFQAPELTRNSPAITIPAFLEAGFLTGFAETRRNDCEPVVRARYPQVAAALDWLGRYAPARLTGTGSCVFAAMANESRARELAAELPAGWQGFVVHGRNRSPLLDRLKHAGDPGPGAA